MIGLLGIFCISTISTTTITEVGIKKRPGGLFNSIRLFSDIPVSAGNKRGVNIGGGFTEGDLEINKESVGVEELVSNRVRLGELSMGTKCVINMEGITRTHGR